MNKTLQKRLRTIKQSALKLSNTGTDIKNKALVSVAGTLIENARIIIEQNNIDVRLAKKSNLSPSLIDRLVLTESRIKSMTDSVKQIAELNDPTGEIISEWTTSNNLHIKKIRVPLGVICMIYESRPNVTIDSAALCLKSGNAVILRGGKESINTNRILSKLFTDAAYKAGIPEGTVLFIDTPDKKIVYELIKSDSYIDLIIPRGNEKMIRSIREKATVPVLSHGKGLCHTYIDEYANVEMAKKIAYNAKVQRPGVCNAMETLLIHKNIADKVLPELAAMYNKAGVKLKGCKKTFKSVPGITLAAERDWNTEYLDLILSVKIVDSLNEAIEHINKYGSGHSESIISESKTNIDRFAAIVDASGIFINASTRLHDGGVFGLGSEIGISTQKLHARGTMGLKELTTTKYVVYGTGQIRE